LREHAFLYNPLVPPRVRAFRVAGDAATAATTAHHPTRAPPLFFQNQLVDPPSPPGSVRVVEMAVEKTPLTEEEARSGL
jgi:hypothetical protein